MSSVIRSSGSERDIPRQRLLLWIAALAIIVRLLYFFEYSASPFFGIPILDEAYYDSVARALVADESTSQLNPAFRPMLYSAVLATIFQLTQGWEYAAAFIFQHLLGILITLLVADLGRRLFDSAMAGAAAGVLYTLAGPPLYFESQLLNTTLFTALAALLLSVKVDRPPTSSRALLMWGFTGACFLL